MAKHPYLNFSDSTYATGKVVGTSDFVKIGNGLTKTNIKIVQIPPVFDDELVVEIGTRSLQNTQITYVFVSKNIRYINWGAFESTPLVEIRFEKGSKLEKINVAAFYNCKSLTKIDFPSSIKEIVQDGEYYLFHSNTVLSCVSYLGTYNFESINMFSNTPAIHVSSSYPASKLGNVDITKDDSTCGISNERFYPTRNHFCTNIIRYQYKTNFIPYVILMSYI